MIDFLEYSRNIPWNILYSKILHILVVYHFFGNIPGIFHIPIFLIILLLQFLFGIFHIPKVRKKRCRRKYSEYSIFLLKEKKRCGTKKLEYSMLRIQKLKFWVAYKMEYFLVTKKSELTLPPEYFVSIGEHLPPTIT